MVALFGRPCSGETVMKNCLAVLILNPLKTNSHADENSFCLHVMIICPIFQSKDSDPSISWAEHEYMNISLYN